MIENLLSRLDGVRQTGNQKWVARCPAHADKSPSLSVAETGDGKVLLKCFAGCAADDVVGAIGLEMRDLFPESTLTKGERKAHAIKQSRDQVERAFHHELVVLTIVVANRISSRELEKDKKFRALRPEWRPLPDSHWDRETLAVSRIRTGLEVLYG